jgi:hypothetical protein
LVRRGGISPVCMQQTAPVNLAALDLARHSAAVEHDNSIAQHERVSEGRANSNFPAAVKGERRSFSTEYASVDRAC